MADDEVIDVDVDAATAKGYGDYYMEAQDYQSAIGCYQDALDQGPDAELAVRCHYNMANAYRLLGDQANCLPHAVEVCRYHDEQIQKYGLRLYYWAQTGEQIPNL